METSLVKWTAPVPAPVRKETPALPAPQGGAAHAAAPGMAAPRPLARSALSDKLVRQMRQRDNPQPAAADPRASVFDARIKRAEESIAATAALG